MSTGMHAGASYSSNMLTSGKTYKSPTSSFDRSNKYESIPISTVKESGSTSSISPRILNHQLQSPQTVVDQNSARTAITNHILLHAYDKHHLTSSSRFKTYRLNQFMDKKKAALLSKCGFLEKRNSIVCFYCHVEAKLTESDHNNYHSSNSDCVHLLLMSANSDDSPLPLKVQQTSQRLKLIRQQHHILICLTSSLHNFTTAAAELACYHLEYFYNLIPTKPTDLVKMLNVIVQFLPAEFQIDSQSYSSIRNGSIFNDFLESDFSDDLANSTKCSELDTGTSAICSKEAVVDVDDMDPELNPLCLKCKQNTRCYVVLPCQEFVYCAICAQKDSNCCKCKRKMEGLIRVFTC